MQYLSFSAWVISLSIMPSRSIHVVASVRISFFLWLNNIRLWYSNILYIYILYTHTHTHIHTHTHTHFLFRSSMNGHFCVLAIVNNTVVNMRVQVSFQVSGLSSLNEYSEVEMLDHMVILLLMFSRILHTFFHSGCTNLHSHQQCTGAASFPHPFQHLLSLVFW